MRHFPWCKYLERFCTVKNIPTAIDILWRVFHILTEKNVHGLHHSVDLRIPTYTEPAPLKDGKLVGKYPWIYGYFFAVNGSVGGI